MISLAELIDVPSPPDRVWEVVSDPSAVVSCVGGAELGESHDDGSFDALLVVRFGGIRVKFAARVTLELDEAEREGRLTARGRDGQGATRFHGTAVFAVTEDPATGGSQVSMNGEVNLSGKLAPLIESGAGVVVKKMTREFSEAFTQLCAEPVHAEPVHAEPVHAGSVHAGPVHTETAAPVADETVLVAPARPGLWRRIRERLARLFGRGRSLPPPSRPDRSPSTASTAPSRGGRP
ncbi:SRPBCC domain-containing protein [Streptomyces sp. MMCC 100]|uniref:SRPBCC domain-containing protein n=1 Tax=Streptomyces sp. MMCC 100 TaxID=3163555 RepID=UPI00359A18ED